MKSVQPILQKCTYGYMNNSIVNPLKLYSGALQLSSTKTVAKLKKSITTQDPKI